VDNAGFMVMRSEMPSGPYRTLNGYLIPSAGSPVSGASYEFEDREVRRRAVYYYKLVDVDLSGVMTEHGPIAGSWDRTAHGRSGRGPRR
jgi:hypothetical protein